MLTLTLMLLMRAQVVDKTNKKVFFPPFQVSLWVKIFLMSERRKLAAVFPQLALPLLLTAEQKLKRKELRSAAGWCCG